MAKRELKSEAQKANATAVQLELELVQFKMGGNAISFNLDVDHETMWATQEQIADLFERDRSSIAEHIKNIFKENELDEKAVCGKFPHTATDGKTHQVIHYNLDMILSVGYRVSSPKATEFRKWATSTLKSYVVDGYAINEARMSSDPGALRKLASHIRKLRSDEANIYEAVRTVFKDASIDYDPKSDKCGKFYAILQDKFHYAIHQKTAAGLVLDRANYREPNMGVQTFEGNMPSVKEAQIGKNYLDSDELYVLHILCEQFLLYAESSAIRGKTLTMDELSAKLDQLLSVNEYPVFKGYKAALATKAKQHAKAEYALYLGRLRREDRDQIS